MAKAKVVEFGAPFVRSAYNYDRRAASRECARGPGEDDSPTVQSAKDDCDINVIVKRFMKTGVLPVVQRGPAITGSVTPMEFRDALDLVRQGQAEFDALPARVRRHFLNDPARFVEACQDPSRVEELRSLGLANPPLAPAASPQPPAGGLTPGSGPVPPAGGQGA